MKNLYLKEKAGFFLIFMGVLFIQVNLFSQNNTNVFLTVANTSEFINEYSFGNDSILNITQEICFTGYPNLFSSSIYFKFCITRPEFVSLKIFNSSGELVDIVINEKYPSGVYEEDWLPVFLPSGDYYYTFFTGDLMKKGKLVYKN